MTEDRRSVFWRRGTLLADAGSNAPHQGTCVTLRRLPNITWDRPIQNPDDSGAGCPAFPESPDNRPQGPKDRLRPFRTDCKPRESSRNSTASIDSLGTVDRASADERTSSIVSSEHGRNLRPMLRDSNEDSAESTAFLLSRRLPRPGPCTVSVRRVRRLPWPVAPHTGIVRWSRAVRFASRTSPPPSSSA
jgi:hypothetical protein